jgi:hypothetical protein
MRPPRPNHSGLLLPIGRQKMVTLALTKSDPLRGIKPGIMPLGSGQPQNECRERGEAPTTFPPVGQGMNIWILGTDPRDV